MKSCAISYLDISKQRYFSQPKSGFTIVELLIVIVVIGILATITIVSYTGVSNKATVASVQADLTNALRQLKMYQVEHGSFPVSLGGDNCPSPVDTNYCLKAGLNTTYLYSVNSDSSPQSFSLYATKNSTRYNITNNSNPTLATQVVATGGTVTDIGGYRIHTFNTVGVSTFTVTSGGNVELLVVGGGGGGGSSQVSSGGGGGGGAGGLVYYASYAVSPGPITVNIGNGGVPGTAGSNQSGTNGGDSVFDSITALGGGFGAKTGVNGGAGGSGGGGGYNGYTTIHYGGNGTTGQGYAGGNTTLLAWAGGAGGGGAGSVGGDNKISHNGGDRGPGVSNSISGSSVMYSIGGGGGANSPIASPANTGKGGDAAYAGGPVYAGGSGIVIVRYPY